MWEWQGPVRAEELRVLMRGDQSWSEAELLAPVRGDGGWARAARDPDLRTTQLEASVDGNGLCVPCTLDRPEVPVVWEDGGRGRRPP